MEGEQSEPEFRAAGVLPFCILYGRVHVFLGLSSLVRPGLRDFGSAVLPVLQLISFITPQVRS